MGQRKVFVLTFFATLLLATGCFLGLYLLIDSRSREADAPRKGVSVKTPGVEDSKTVLAAVGSGENPSFFLLKFNAIQNKIGIMTISPSFCRGGRKLRDTLEGQGAKGCLLSLEEELGIDIDYYLRCSWEEAGYIAGGLEPVAVDTRNLPPRIARLTLKRAEKLGPRTLAAAADKARGLSDSRPVMAFMNEYLYGLIKTNLTRLSGKAGDRIKEDYRRLDTDLNARALSRFSVILGFLGSRDPEYPRRIIAAGDRDAREKARQVTG